MRRIIGIDPGLVHTGWGVVDSIGNERHYVASGVILPHVKDPLPARLSFIFNEITGILNIWEPTECGIEITFANRNPATSLVLGHARAAAILAVSEKKIPIFEYEANKIKKAIAASGHADKMQIAGMVKILLPAANPETADESDALAIALCHANHSRF